LIPTLDTYRLRLVPIDLSDAGAIQREFPHWAIIRQMAGTIPWPYPDDGAETYLKTVALPAMANGEAWHWSLRLKAQPIDLIGMISLTIEEDDNRGFWMARAWQRKGLMTEAATAATDYWFDVLNQPVLRAPKAKDNFASRRISERSGMRIVKTIEKALVSGIKPVDIWEVTAAEWRAHRSMV
jgi:[ribosomal protein S5]-alanine N-acetyltransferase